MGVFTNAFGIGVGQGANVNLLPFKDDLSFHSIGRTGLSLIDEISGNNASILPSAISTAKGVAAARCLTDITPIANTVWVIKGKMTDPTISNAYMGVDLGSHKFCFGVVDFGAGIKFAWKWGSAYALLTVPDTDFHVIIIYNKKLWILPEITDVSTDALILNIINTVTATSTLSATWTDGSSTLAYANVTPTTQALAYQFVFSYVGTITTGVITWQGKHIFTDVKYVYDLLSSKMFSWTGSGMLKKYSTIGDQTCLNIGYSLYQLEGSDDLKIPYLANGTARINPTILIGYIFVRNVSGDIANHNLANSKIRFALGSVFDRSNTLIWKTESRATTTYYDATNPTDWHVSELNNLLMREWLNVDYYGIPFVKITPNSCILDERLLLKELFSYTTNKTGSDFNSVLKYVNDYNIIVL